MIYCDECHKPTTKLLNDAQCRLMVCDDCRKGKHKGHALPSDPYKAWDHRFEAFLQSQKEEGDAEV